MTTVPLPSADPGPLRSYGPADTQVLEDFPGDRGTVFLVHGGFWRARTDRSHARAAAVAMADRGWRVLLPEYPRPGMPGGGWPGTGDELRRALEWVAETPGPLVLAGHSAGGQLALWLAHQPVAARAAAVVPLGGCLDLRLVHDLGLGDHAAGDFLGGSPEEQPEAYATADPAQLGPAPCPVVVVHGRDDDIVPLEVSRSWFDRCARPDRDRLLTVDGDHFAVMDPSAPAFATVLETLDGFR